MEMNCQGGRRRGSVGAEAHSKPRRRLSFGSNESESKPDCTVGKGQLWRTWADQQHLGVNHRKSGLSAPDPEIHNVLET